MCGIASFLSNRHWSGIPDTQWLTDLAASFDAAVAGNDLMDASTPLDDLAAHFYDLMAFGMHMQSIADPEVNARLSAILDSIRNLRNAAAVKLEQGPRTDELEALHEKLDDYLWQIDQEVLQNIDRTLAIMPSSLASDPSARDRHFLAWGTEQVLESIDKLEVRGRDSAGVAVAFILPKGMDPELRLSDAQKKNSAPAAPLPTPTPDRCSSANSPTGAPPAASCTRWHSSWGNSVTTARPCAISSWKTICSGPWQKDWKP